ncbi:MAG TPA: antibiotic biosynthesis monooxygenase family protein [Candidatus Acidoferrales bacterium]|nr:antibiotic biosynthesis monooxygenase family protein [Candidatus Acidoferrales bacterium]
MIRVLYRFKVAIDHEDAFVESWSKATEEFREEVPGAFGSQLFRSRKNSGEFVTLARWSSWEDWEAFRRGVSPARDAVTRMASVSELVSTETFDEVLDLLSQDAMMERRR